MTQCTAKSKRTGQRCGAQAVRGRNVCYHHGGATPRGPDNANWKHGRNRRHKVLPPRMVEAYEASLKDPELLSLREEISLVDARITDLLKRIDTGESGRLWGLLSDAYDKLREHRNDPAKGAYWLNEIGALIHRGVGDYAAWGELSNKLEQRRRLVESESKRMKDMQAMISAEETMALMGEIYVILQTHITDSVILDRIGRDITTRVTRPSLIDAG